MVILRFIVSVLSLIGLTFKAGEFKDGREFGQFVQTLLLGSYHQLPQADSGFWEIKTRSLSAKNYHFNLYDGSKNDSEEELRSKAYAKCKNLIVVFYEGDAQSGGTICGVVVARGLHEEYFMDPLQTHFPLSSDKTQVRAHKFHFVEHFKTVRSFGRVR